MDQSNKEVVGDVKIRSARPDDAPFLAWVILTAGRGHCQRGVWDVIIGKSEHECLALLEQLVITETLHTFHYTGFIVAEVDGLLVAAISGYDPMELGRDKEALGGLEAGQKIGLTETDWEKIQKGISTISAVRPDEIEGAWTLESVAVLPEFRRSGLMNQLMEEMLEIGRRRGFHLAQGSVFIGNTASLKACEKCGFRVVDEKRHPDFESETGCPGLVKLLLDL